MTNNPHNPTNEPDNVADDNAGSSYEPSYSEPNWDTSSADAPLDAEIVTDETAAQASPPDASSPTGGPSSHAPGAAQGGPAAQPAPGQAHGSGATGYGQQPPYGQSAPGQQAQWGGDPSQQQYQQQPGGMPPQPYSGGPGQMAAGSNNPNYFEGPTERGRSTLQLDYWLSVFFSWIPALIFFLTERDKNKLVDEHTKEVMNFNITRVIAYAVIIVPVIGWIVGGIASIALFVVAILGALKGPEEYANGRTYQFPLTIRFIK